MAFSRRDLLKYAGAGIGALCLDSLCGGSLSHAATTSAGTVSYTVRKGDSLYAIARRFHSSIPSIKQLNSLSSDIIYVGDKLRVPVATSATATPLPPISYTVRRGDTLSAIAREHDSSVAGIQSLNHLKGDTIYIGQKLKIPRGADSSSSSSKPQYQFVSKVQKEIDGVPLNAKRWKHILLHHSGTTSGNGKIFDYYHRNIRHMENGLAYHFVIGNGTDSEDGQIEISERWYRQIHGGHVKTEWYNQNSIGICLVGNFQEQKPHTRQIAALIELVTHLKTDLLNGRPKILLHREIEKTLCPGQYFPAKNIHKMFG